LILGKRINDEIKAGFQIKTYLRRNGLSIADKSTEFNKPLAHKKYMAKVSVIIPAYNSARYLLEAIQGVLHQTYQDFEIIVVDDGSADTTEEIIEGFIKEYPSKIRHIYQKNRGPAAARNRAMQAAKGEFIAFLDADDVWYSDKLEKQVYVLEHHPEAGFVYCDSNFIDAESNPIQNYFRKTKILNGDILIELFCNHFIMTPAVMLRKSCLNQTGLFDENLTVGEDYDFFLRLAYYYKARSIDEILWSRRVLNESLSRADFILDARNDLNTLKRFMMLHREFYKKNRDLVQDRLAKYHFSLAYNCLEHGKNIIAFNNLVSSVCYHPTLKAFKNILFCCVPLWLRRKLQRHVTNPQQVDYA